MIGLRVCPECDEKTSKHFRDCSVCGYVVGKNEICRVAPSIPAARMARKLAEAQAARMEDIPHSEMEAVQTSPLQVLRPVTASDVEIILNHLRIRHRETLSRSDYAELDAIIKRLES